VPELTRARSCDRCFTLVVRCRVVVMPGYHYSCHGDCQCRADGKHHDGFTCVRLQQSTARAQIETFPSLLKEPTRKTPIWMTTTWRYDSERSAGDELEYGAQAATELGWRVLDRRSITRPLWDAVSATGGDPMHVAWSDPAHFQPYVYSQITNALLAMLCTSA
jgi:hypothetical protein